MQKALSRIAMVTAPLLAAVSLGIVGAAPASANDEAVIPLTAATPDYPCGSSWYSMTVHLVWQCDGNLVLYSNFGYPYTALWASGTNGWSNITNPTTNLNFSRGGAMRIRDHNNEVVCAWGGPTAAGGNVTVQNDGNLVVYQSDGIALWASGTNNSYGHPGNIHACQ